MFDRRRCDIQGSPVSYLFTGKESSPALILLHGGGSDYSEFSWREVLPELAEHFSVYAPDLPGYGYSPLPSVKAYLASPAANPIGDVVAANQKHPSAEQTSTLTLHTIFLKHFINQLGLDSPNLVGFSMGGAICLLHGLVFPETFSRIAVINSYGVSERIRRQQLAWITARIPFLPQALRFVLGRSAFVMRMALGELVGKRREIKQEMVIDAMNSVRLVGTHPLWKQFVMQEILFSSCNLNVRPKLTVIGSRLCLIQTDKDRLFFPKEAQDAAMFCGADFRLLKNAGHIPARDCPGELSNHLLSFFGSQ